MKRTLLTLSLLMAAGAYAEGGIVTAGPLTSIDKLQSFNSVKNAPTPRRSIKIESWQTSNGAKVLFVAAPELPMIDVRVVFNAGSARDGDKFGLSSLVSRMLDEGTPTRSTDDISAAFENLGASFSASAYRDMFVVDLRVLSQDEFLQPALEVFSDVLAHPMFPEEPFKRIFDGAQVGQQQRQQSPSAQASILFYQNLYGSHPYAHPSHGTPETLKKITTDDLKAFHKQYLVAKNATIAIVGNLDKQQALTLSEKISQPLASGEAAATLAKVKPLDKAVHKHLAFPSQQTHIMMGQANLRRDNPDYEALYVGNEILGGGGFGSILMEELREKRGLTYGVYSGLSPMQVEGPFIINLSTRNEQTTQALELLRKNLREFIQKGINEQQLKQAKDNILGSFPLSTSSNSSILAYLASMGFYNQPLDYLDSFNDRINKVTAKDVQKAFQRYIHPDKMLTVTVGQGVTVAKNEKAK